MKNPAKLSHGELAEIATRMLQILYGKEHQDGSWTYAADKEWCGGDICQDAASLLDRYGLVPQKIGLGEPMDSANEPCRSHDFDLKIDGPVLREQRLLLLAVANDLNRGRRQPGYPGEKELVEGLLSLTDEIADQAADRYGIDCLLPVSDESNDTNDGDQQQVSSVSRYILYDFDEGNLATTRVYDQYDEAAADADQLDNVVILALEFEEENPEPCQDEQPSGEPGPSD